MKKYPNGTQDIIKAPPRREEQKGMDDATWERLFEHYKPLGEDGIVEVGVYVKVRTDWVHSYVAWRYSC